MRADAIQGLLFPTLLFTPFILFIFCEIIGPIAGLISGLFAPLIGSRTKSSIFLRLLLWGFVIWLFGLPSEYINETVKYLVTTDSGRLPPRNTTANVDLNEDGTVVLGFLCVFFNPAANFCIIDELIQPLMIVIFVAVMEYMFESNLKRWHINLHANIRIAMWLLFAILLWFYSVPSLFTYGLGDSPEFILSFVLVPLLVSAIIIVPIILGRKYYRFPLRKTYERLPN